MNLLLLALVLLVASGIIALCIPRPTFSTTVATVGAVAGCVVGLKPALAALFGYPLAQVQLPWRAPTGDLLLGLDALSAFFLVPLLILSAMAAIYGRGYLLAYGDRRALGPPAFSFNMLVAALVATLIARTVVFFLVSWELVTLFAYFLVSFDHARAEVRRAGRIYLIAGHISMAALMAMFLLLERRAHGFSFAAFCAMPAAGAALNTLIFALALIGFGVKAGIIPFHVWLPEAHAVAPSHVSALMSGVLIKVGIYGLLRITTFIPPAPFFGPILMMLGLIGALWGISQALHQRDMKRILAYSSIENIGLITLGLGIAFWGAQRGNYWVAALGAVGGLLHVWNHVLMKGLMFFCAGSVLHASGTQNLEQLGGLMKRMRRTGLLMFLGGMAIAGLPPLNGLVSEWLLYRGLIQGGLNHHGAGQIAVLLGSGALALVGGLAALCFVRLLGMVLLGEARGDAARKAHESPLEMLVPMGLLALASILIAIRPQTAVGALTRVIEQIFGNAVTAQLGFVQDSLRTFGIGNAVIWATLGLMVLIWWRVNGKASVSDAQKNTPVETWGCGYVAPSARMQYTAGSFSQIIAQRLFPEFFRARVRQSRKITPETFFPSPENFTAEHDDPLTRSVYEPFFIRWADELSRLRWFQQGALNLYLLYILVVVVLALAWTSLGNWGLGR